MIHTEPSNLPYWARKLAAFRARPRLFPAFLEAPGERVSGLEVDWPEGLAPGTDRGPDALDLLALGALAALVARYTGDGEVLIAAPGAQGVVFQRAAPEPALSTARFLEMLRAERDESRMHADYAYADLVALLGMEARDVAAACFRLGFRGLVDGRAPWPAGVEPDVCLTLDPPETDGGAPRARLSVHGYAAAFALQLARHLGRVLAFLALGEAAELDAVELLDAGEQRRVARDFNGARAETPRGATLHSLFARQAAERPEAEAVVQERRRLSYGAVSELATRLAAHLRARRGVRTGDTVGLIMRSSELLPPIMLGVLQAGAAYVPIDRRHPRAVVDGMLADAGCRVLIVDSDSVAHAAAFRGEVLVADVELADLPPAEGPLPPVASHELAYVIFTSGSTGRPKGVAVEHRAIVNTICWRNRFYGFGRGDAILQMPSYAFDSSVPDFYCALTTGARLVIPDEDRRLDPEYVRRLILAERVTHFIVTPSFYHALVAGVAPAAGVMRSVTVAGEAIPPELVEEHFRHLPHVRLCNEYGPTENSVCSSAAWLTPGQHTAPIGVPVDNTQALVLDARGRLVPVGVPGEIYLGGPGLARGYLGQPGQTAAAFVPSPRPEWLPGRLYRSGDRGAWRDDGQLEFFGRADNQVKVRGHRIELDHVEGTVRAHPGLEQAVVVVKGQGVADRRLAAYVVPRGEGSPPALRRWLAERLPHFMVPDVIVPLPALPLNGNGKVDRDRLRRRDDSAGAGPAGAAASALEAALLALYADVLERRDVGREDNFFEAGGNSLRALDLVTRVRAQLHRELGVREVYTYPSVSELARRLESAGPDNRELTQENIG